MIEWVKAHWLEIVTTISVLGWVFDNILAEIPSVSANSTFRLVKGVIDKLAAKVKVKSTAPLLLLLCLPLLAGCATTKSESTQNLIAVKDMIVAARQAAVEPCKHGDIAKEDCARIDTMYEEAKPIYDAAADAMIAFIDGTGSKEAYTAKAKALASLASSITALVTGGSK